MSPARPLRLVLEQTAPVLGETGANGARIVKALEAPGDPDLVAFPELALTGYGIGDRAQELALEAQGRPPIDLPASGPAALFGFVERGPGHLVYNAAVLARGERILARHRKVYLPTYGIFEEGRIFAPGRAGPRAFELHPGWRAGILVCEDLWHPALPYLLALQRVDLILVLSSAPGRGEDPDGVPRFASSRPWELLARAAAFNHGVYVALVNRVGSEGALTFAGGSLVVAPDGEVAARAPEDREARLEVELALARVREARHPFSHLRDEDPALTAREIRRILGEVGSEAHPPESAPGHLDL